MSYYRHLTCTILAASHKSGHSLPLACTGEAETPSLSNCLWAWVSEWQSGCPSSAPSKPNPWALCALPTCGHLLQSVSGPWARERSLRPACGRSWSAGVLTAEPPRTRSTVPASCPGSCELIPGWKCKQFPRGKVLILADDKWERLAAVNIDGYSLQNDFRVV